jgi:hypothetical protein
MSAMTVANWSDPSSNPYIANGHIPSSLGWVTFSNLLSSIYTISLLFACNLAFLSFASIVLIKELFLSLDWLDCNSKTLFPLSQCLLQCHRKFFLFQT